MLDVVKELGRVEGLSPLEGVNDAWDSVVKMPGAEALGVFFLSKDRGQLFFCRAAQGFDKALALAILKFVKAHEEELRSPAPLALVSGLKDPRGMFDAVVGVSHVVHQAWTPINPHVTNLSIAIYPIYRCELSGHESADILRVVIPRKLNVGDWNRDPEPIAWMRFTNTKTGVKTTNKGFGVDTPDTLYDAITEMSKQGSMTEAKNFKDQLLRFEYRDGALWAQAPGADATKTSKKAALALANRFLTEGV